MHVNNHSSQKRPRATAPKVVSLAVGLSLIALGPSAAAEPATKPESNTEAAPSAAKSTHGLSAFGKLKYPADFSHFDYVNADAPKGGKLSMIGPAGVITFDSFNAYILTGDPAQGMGYVFDSLMTRAYDEPDAVYSLVAKSATVASDRMSVTFNLRPEAKFSDNRPVTADDVVFSFNVLKKEGHPRFRITLRDVVSAEKIDDFTVKYTFQGELVRDLPLVVADLPIFSKKYYTENEFGKVSLKPPIGSGPYKVDKFNPGTFVTYKRRDDYWAKDLPVNRGRFNFDELRYEYYRDRTSELENLKSGNFDLREEFTSVDWATAYNIDAVKQGRLQRITLPDGLPSGAQGFFINTRREKFKDVRVRKALDYAFDFEWSNKNLFYGLYQRTASYFENSEMKASGKPSPAELELLEPFRNELPKSVFEDVYVPPVSNASGTDRKLLRIAATFLDEAGWSLKNGRRVSKSGEKLEIEFLTFSKSFVRIIEPYIRNLERLGIKAHIRLVDPAQYERRVKSFDFDITTQRYVLPLTPGIEMKNYWGSTSAAIDGSFNLSGIANPAMDALIDKAITANSRQELQTAARAIDRILRSSHYWVPHWYKASYNVAFWNKFSWPQTKPQYSRGIIETWWFDPEKAAKLTQKQ